MAKKKKVSRPASKSKSIPYRAETYGIKFDSMTFLLFSVFALVVSVLLVSSMMGFRMF